MLYCVLKGRELVGVGTLFLLALLAHAAVRHVLAHHGFGLVGLCHCCQLLRSSDSQTNQSVLYIYLYCGYVVTVPARTRSRTGAPRPAARGLGSRAPAG
eukprot:6481185-Pyramimonas_sp.AAC.1